MFDQLGPSVLDTEMRAAIIIIMWEAPPQSSGARSWRVRTAYVGDVSCCICTDYTLSSVYFL